MNAFNDWLYWRHVIGAFVLPPAGLMLFMLAGFIVRRWLPRLGAVFVAIGFLALWIVATPFTALYLDELVNPAKRFDRSQLGDARAIVILGGGLRPGALEYGGFTMSQLTSERVRYGVRLARELNLPILVSGGVTRPRWPAEADIMAESMKAENLIEPRWLERRSRNTRQNAQFSAEILANEGIKRIVLVTHGVDLARGKREFEAFGLEVVAAPTRIAWRGDEPYELRDFIPSVHSLRDSYYVVYELLASVVNGPPPVRSGSAP